MRQRWIARHLLYIAVSPGGSVCGDLGKHTHEPSLSRCSQLQSCELWRILDTTRNLAAPLSVDEILRKTLAAALQVLNADRGSVFLFDPKTSELYIKLAAGLRATGATGGFEAVIDSVYPPITSPERDIGDLDFL